MPQISSPYAGERVALATRHGKQRVIGRALRHGLGAELLHLPDIDTDALGSFCGTVERRGTALEAGIAKAELALEHGGTGLAIASEGSFGPHPALPLLAVGLEVMVFLDRERGLTIQEQLLTRRTNFAQRQLSLAAIESESGRADLQRWLQAVGFPSHGLIVRPQANDAGAAALHKGVHDWPTLLTAIRTAAAATPEPVVLLDTDMRAHCNPTRMASIRQLSFRLVRRIRSLCPACGAPGWGLERHQAGLPCAWCRTPTSLNQAEIFGCRQCGHEQRRPRHDGLEAADPGQCPSCNP